MGAYEFEATRRIEFADTDMAGIVHFANFFRYMEATEHRFYRALGLDLHGGGNVDSGWPRVQASCDYRSPLRFEDRLAVRLLVREKKSRSLRYLFSMERLEVESDDDSRVLVAVGEMTAVSVARDSDGRLRSVPIPDAFDQAIEPAPPELIEAWEASLAR